MLTLENAPDAFTPNPIGQPARWEIYNPDLRVVVGQPNTYILRFTSAGANAQAFTLAGVAFTTSDATSYTSTTFDHTVADFRSAMNCADMLRSNAAFRSYSIRTARPENGEPWRVIAVAQQNIDATADENNNDLSALAGVTVEQIAGLTEVRLNQRVFYQFYDNSGPVSPEYYAPFNLSGRCVIDGSEVARRYLRAIAPDPEQQQPVNDQQALQYLSVKYGTYTTDNNCSPSFGEVAQTPASPFLYSVRQVDQVNGLRPFGPAQQSPQRWLSIRSNDRRVSADGYDWAAIYLGPNPFFSGAENWRLRKEYFDDADNSLSVEEILIDGAGLWRFPAGFANAVPDGIGDVARFTLTIQEPFGFNWANRSETITVTRSGARCREAQILYLGALGGWEIFNFEELNSRRITTEGIAWTEPLTIDDSYAGAVLADEGGTYQRVTNSATPFTVTTSRITERDRLSLEELVESPALYLLDQDENGRTVTRRLLISRGTVPTYSREGRTVATLSFLFAQPRRLR